MNRSLMLGTVLLLVVLSFPVILPGCKNTCRRIDLLPIDPDFDLHVNAVIADYERVLEDFVLLQEEYNSHLFGNHPGTTEELYAYMSVCEREVLKSDIDTTLSALERLRILDEKVDALVDCAWVFERSFSAHFNRYHGVWNCEWAKFYSPVPEDLASATFVRCVEENLEGVNGFVISLRTDYEDHLEEYHVD